MLRENCVGAMGMRLSDCDGRTAVAHPYRRCKDHRHAEPPNGAACMMRRGRNRYMVLMMRGIEI